MLKNLSRTIKRKSLKAIQIGNGPWNEAIREAQRQIEEVEKGAEEKVARLARSLKTLEALRDSGAEFPAMKSAE